VLAAEEKLEVYLNQKLGSVPHAVSFIVTGAAQKLG